VEPEGLTRRDSPSTPAATTLLPRLAADAPGWSPSAWTTVVAVPLRCRTMGV